MLNADILGVISQSSEAFVAFRRELHLNPELGFNEIETTKRILSKLSELGIKGETFDQLTGCFVTLGPRVLENAILLRADIDALPIQDLKDCEYRSKVDGKMHACGHDVHTTILVGALNALSKIPNLKRPVVGLFQPAEELGTGAKAVVERGILEGVTSAIGFHVEPNLPVGTIAIRPGAMCACVIEFEIEFKGKSAHGARPHLGHDAVLSACQFVSQCYSLIPRRIDARNPHVLTFGAIHGGSKANIVSESCKLQATIRAFSSEIARKVLDQVRRVAEGICLIHETHHELNLLLDLPAVVTDGHVAQCIKQSASAILGIENVIIDFPTSLGGEDFGVYLDYIKGGMFRVGVASPGKDAPSLHSQNFDVDERVIEIGVKVLVGATLALMED